MRIVNAKFFILKVLLSSIELSSPCAASPSCSAPSSPIRRERSRSPSASYRDPSIRFLSSDVLGYRFDQLALIRLTPTGNPHRQFELRRYTFPPDERIKVLDRRCVFQPVPVVEQIVLSTHDGDVFAIFTRSDTLAGIYRYILRAKQYKRVRMSMESGRIIQLTSSEVQDAPVGDSRLIQHHFRVEHIEQSRRSPPRVDAGVPVILRSHPALPFFNVLGYGLHQIGSIRLCYKGNPHRLFELRRYAFPADKPLKTIREPHRYIQMPIQEQIVLSTSGGDIFAFFSSSNSLAGIYAYDPHTRNDRRAKLNIANGRITLLTSREVQEVPVGPRHQIRLYYIVDILNQTSPQQ